MRVGSQPAQPPASPGHLSRPPTDSNVDLLLASTPCPYPSPLFTLPKPWQTSRTGSRRSSTSRRRSSRTAPRSVPLLQTSGSCSQLALPPPSERSLTPSSFAPTNAVPQPVCQADGEGCVLLACCSSPAARGGKAVAGREGGVGRGRALARAGPETARAGSRAGPAACLPVVDAARSGRPC